LPTFLSTEALINFGYNIDVNYRQLLPVERLQSGKKINLTLKLNLTDCKSYELMVSFLDENYTDYYQRSFNSTKYLTNLHQHEGTH